MPDYSRTIIYKLIHYDYPELVYIGSTTNFTNRKRHHKSNCNNEKSKSFNLKVYINIRENGGFENWNIIKICDYPCNNRREAEQEEDKYMLESKSNMNMKRASRTKEKYYEDNKEYLDDKQKQYRKENRNVIIIKQKQFYYYNKEKK